MKWWSNPISARSAYVVAGLIGLASLFVVHGWDFVLGTSRYWDMPTLQDHRMYVMGYRYFLHEPWHWPVFDTHTNMPYMRSIAFSDTPLLWALLNKAVATVVPPWEAFSARAFLGLWYVLSSVLQSTFGVANLRALGHKSGRVAVLGAVFFVAIPAWTYRFPHAALSSHFLLLWALYLYTRTRGETAKGLRAAQVFQLAVATLTNAYLTTMSLAVFVASLARLPTWRARLGWFLAAFIVVVGLAAFAGYFAPESGIAMTGFSRAGSNLLGPVLPMYSGWVGSRLWTDTTGSQYEGVCYLGVGVLVLVIVVLWRMRETLAVARRHAVLATIAALAAVFALSNHIYLGSHRVLWYPIPQVLHWIPDQFRCPGRFSWLPMYVVVIFVLSRAFLRPAGGWRALVLPVLAVLQLVDVTGDWSRWREYTSRPTDSPLDLPAWRTLLSEVDEISVFPAHDCNSDRTFELATQIQYLSSETALPINSVYSARPLRDCYADVASLLAFHAQPRRLYVFVPPMVGFAKRLAAAGLPCAEFSFGEVCHEDSALIQSLHFPPTPLPPLLRFGDAIELNDPEAKYLELGWASSQPDGRYTDGAVARLVFRPTGDLPPTPQLRIEASAVLCDKRTIQDVDVALGGENIGTLHFDEKTNALGAPRSLTLPHPEVLQQPIVEIEFRPRDLRTPHDLGCSAYTRELTIKVKRVWIEPGPSQRSRGE